VSRHLNQVSEREKLVHYSYIIYSTCHPRCSAVPGTVQREEHRDEIVGWTLRDSDSPRSRPSLHVFDRLTDPWGRAAPYPVGPTPPAGFYAGAILRNRRDE
jgi:hypothetical protein